MGAILRDTYVIEQEIAVGGMGRIFEARHLRLPGRYAVKVLHPRWARNPDALARFHREAEILARLRHPNVVEVFDFDTTSDGIPYLVMERVLGRDLAAHIYEQGPMEPPRAAAVIRQIAAGLEAAHRRGIVHRDLKPANVMLFDCEGMKDVVKLLDFGVSKVDLAGPAMTGRTMLGTPSYMAPEQVEGLSDQIDGRADQFSLAVLAYVLLRGSRPFPGDTTSEVLTRIVNDAPMPLSEPGNTRLEKAEAVLRRALSKRPEDRFDRIGEFSAALERALQAAFGLEDEAGSPPPAVEPASGDASTMPVLRLALPDHPTGPTLPDARAAKTPRDQRQHARPATGRLAAAL